jgi:glutamate-1-semialdehyde aminotransferase
MTKTQEETIKECAQDILDVRASFKSNTLEDLYDRDGMPPELRRAHEKLDKAVDRLYRRNGFKFERERVELLFQLFEQTIAPFDTTTVVTSRRKKRSG